MPQPVLAILTVVLASLVAAEPALARESKTLRVYLVGNSVPPYRKIKEVFADGIHLNNVGSCVLGCTYFATLYKQNPKGLPLEPFKVTDPKLAEVIEETVWSVVSTHELAGVAAGEADGAASSKKQTAIR